MKYIIGAIVMALCTSSYAGFIEGMSAYEKKSYGRAFLEFSPLADSGDADAQFMLGEMYYSGLGVQTSVEKAAEYYTKAAMQGNPKGQMALGFLYQIRGSVLGMNCNKSIYWYKKAADQGHIPAYGELAEKYYYSFGENCSGKNDAEGNKWLIKAAEAGDRSSQSSLRFNYYTGSHGFPKDYSKAYFWARKSAESGFPDYLMDLARMHANGLGAEQDLVVAYALFRLASKDGYEPAVSATRGLESVLNEAQLKEGFVMASDWKVNTPVPTSSRTGKLITKNEQYCRDWNSGQWIWKDGEC